MFLSQFRRCQPVPLPAFSGTRVMMMPVILNDLASIPAMLAHYIPTMESMFALCGFSGEVGYLTIDEKPVVAGKTHRRAGLHVDGVFRGLSGPWANSEGAWGHPGRGMFTVASHSACRAWNQEFDGDPQDEGECDHLAEQCRSDCAEVFEPGMLYWVDGLCVHESMPVTESVDRQFIRLSMPSRAPWFEGYTVNPLGVMPTGPILPEREFMKVA